MQLDATCEILWMERGLLFLRGGDICSDNGPHRLDEDGLLPTSGLIEFDL